MFLMMKASQQDQSVELTGQIPGGRGVKGPAGSWPTGGTGHCSGPCRQGAAPDTGFRRRSPGGAGGPAGVLAGV